jgi:hypothetical protein
MEITKAGVAIVAVACVTLGAAGGYLMTRPAEPTAATAPVPSVSPDPGGLAVEQSEALVTEESPRPAPATPAPAAVTPRPAPKPAATTRPASQRAAAAVPAPAPVPVIEPEPVPLAVAVPPIDASRPVEIELPRPIESAGPQLEDLVIASDSVIGLQVETAVSSETARVEDEVVAKVVRDVRVGDMIAIPAGSKARGEVTLVERGGRMRDRARLGVRFTSIVLADGRTEIPISTETIYREGDAPGRESATKIGGGAIGGAILGGILGGAKGAAIGGAIGGGAGSAAVLAGGRNAATLSPGSPVTVRLQQPATVTVER